LPPPWATARPSPQPSPAPISHFRKCCGTFTFIIACPGKEPEVVTINICGSGFGFSKSEADEKAKEDARRKARNQIKQDHKGCKIISSEEPDDWNCRNLP
jgi:hypothetical protein